MRVTVLTLTGLLAAFPACAQQTSDPFPEPVGSGGETIVVDVVDFASIPDVEGETARMMTLVHEPGTDRVFLSDQRGMIYVVGRDGTVTLYLDADDPRWGVDVDASWREKGLQSFAFHPQFAEEGTPGHGRFYLWTDTPSGEGEADFTPGGGRDAHDTVLLEFRARNPESDGYDGGPPRELARFEQPYPNHNGGEIAFNPLAEPGAPDFGLLYVGVGDGGAGGDPLDLAQDPSSAFGKILRVDPLGTDGRTGEYGIPTDNPFAGDGDDRTLDEIWVYGIRNAQHFDWDPATGRMFVADIGQNTVEEVSVATAGADFGWNVWEGSFRFVPDGGVEVGDPRSDPDVTYPVAEYDHTDPRLGPRSAVTGLHVTRGDAIPQLRDRVLFGDLPSGEIFHFDADRLPEGGQDALGRVLLRQGGRTATLLELVQARNRRDGREEATRTDLRLERASEGRIFVLNKHDGVLRLMVPPAGTSAEAGAPASVDAELAGDGKATGEGRGTAGAGTSASRVEALFRARKDSARMRYTEADVRFMQGMILHHAQALVMAGMAEENGAGPAVRTLAARILNAQRDEIATMEKWLRDRGRSVPDWRIEGSRLLVREGGEEREARRMPGMLSGAQLRELRNARGGIFDRLFLTYMIGHHRGAVEMVGGLFGMDGAAQGQTTFRLASDIQVDQKTEIARMEDMLARRAAGSEGPPRLAR